MNPLDNRAVTAFHERDMSERLRDAGIGAHQSRGGVERTEPVAAADRRQLAAPRDERPALAKMQCKLFRDEAAKLFIA